MLRSEKAFPFNIIRLLPKDPVELCKHFWRCLGIHLASEVAGVSVVKVAHGRCTLEQDSSYVQSTTRINKGWLFRDLSLDVYIELEDRERATGFQRSQLGER